MKALPVPIMRKGKTLSALVCKVATMHVLLPEAFWSCVCTRLEQSSQQLAVAHNKSTPQ